MTPTALFATLTTAGLQLHLEGTTLYVTPHSRITPDWRAAIRTHRAALIQLLQTPAEDPGPWHYSSNLLDAELWLCLTPAHVAALPPDAVGYLPHEVRALQALKARDPEGYAAKVVAVHQAKAIFGATVETP